MLGACLAFVGMQAVVKVARRCGLDTLEVLFFRTAPGLPFLWLGLRRAGEGLRPREPRDVLVRALLGFVAMSTNFASMRWLSLVQFTTLNLMQPVFVALLAPLLLTEHVRRSTWLALLFALSGALVIVTADAAITSIPRAAALLALGSALASAFAQIWVRKATVSDPPLRVVFHFAALVSLLSLGAGLLTGRFRGPPAGTSPLELAGLVAGLAAFGTLGQVLMTRAYSIGEAAPVSMVAYSGIAFGLGVDLLVFDHAPTPTALAGAGLILVAGVTLLRDR
jgi:drug/metabolite transporter (DMT)-like permease